MAMKTEKDIERELIQDFVAAQDKVTYFGSGSVIRGLLHSIARRLGELWYDYGQKVKTLFLSTSSESDLDIYGLNRGISRLEASSSQSLLVFKGTNATVIPEMTQITGDHGFIFETQSEITINTDGGYNFGSEGLGASVLARCLSTGAVTNVAENAVNQLVAPIAGVDSVTNPLPTHYGVDNESDEEYRYRIKHQISILNKTTESFITEMCKEAIPDISRVFVEKAIGENTINVYTITRSNTYLNTAQKEYVKNYLGNRWVILPQVNILDMPVIDVNISMTVRPVAGYDLADIFISIADSVMEYLDFRMWVLGEDVDSDDIIQICLNDDKVDDIDVPNFVPGGDIEVAYNSIPVLANITIIHMDNPSITINLNLNPSF